jgi:opacity protein-like surface antigen
MNKFLLAAALVVVCSAPVLADGGKSHKAKQTYVGSTAEAQWSWKKARRKLDRATVKEDPYWEPCDYMANGGPRACGGGGG